MGMGFGGIMRSWMLKGSKDGMWVVLITKARVSDLGWLCEMFRVLSLRTSFCKHQTTMYHLVVDIRLC